MKWVAASVLATSTAFLLGMWVRGLKPVEPRPWVPGWRPSRDFDPSDYAGA